MSWLLREKDIDILVLCLGANDMLRGIRPNLIRQNLNRILEILEEKKITVLLAGMKSQEDLDKNTKEFDKIYPELAKNLISPFCLSYLKVLH